VVDCLGVGEKINQSTFKKSYLVITDSLVLKKSFMLGATLSHCPKNL
jgi:hypothetical protein